MASKARLLTRTFQYILLLNIWNIWLCGGWQYRKLVKVNQGTGLDYHELWDFTGYTCDDDADGNSRSASIDRPNTDNCLFAYHVNFRPSDTSFRQYPVNASLYSWLNKPPFLATYGASGKTISVSAKSNPRMYLHDVGDDTKFYMAVWYSIGSLSPRIFDASPRVAISVADTAAYIAGTGSAPSNLLEGTFFQVIGKYQDNCNPDEPIGTIHLPVAECYALTACPLTPQERQDTRFKEGLFMVSERHSDHLPESDIVWVETVQSILSCGVLCRKDFNCLSFFFSESTHECHGYKHVMSFTDSPKDNPGMKHFVNQYCDI